MDSVNLVSLPADPDVTRSLLHAHRRHQGPRVVRLLKRGQASRFSLLLHSMTLAIIFDLDETLGVAVTRRQLQQVAGTAYLRRLMWVALRGGAWGGSFVVMSTT